MTALRQIAVVARFLLVGVINTGTGLAIVALLRRIGATEFLANFAGLATGVAVGYLLNRRWTFRSRQRAPTTIPLYLAAFSLAYSCNLCVLALCLQLWKLNADVSQALALLSYSSVFYFLCRSVVFRTSQAERRSSTSRI